MGLGYIAEYLGLAMDLVMCTEKNAGGAWVLVKVQL